MSDKVIATTAGETWMATAELRWRGDTLITHLSDFGEALVGKKIRVLEQKWRCLVTGAEEWRAIPEVEGGLT